MVYYVSANLVQPQGLVTEASSQSKTKPTFTFKSSPRPRQQPLLVGTTTSSSQIRKQPAPESLPSLARAKHCETKTVPAVSDGQIGLGKTTKSTIIAIGPSFNSNLTMPQGSNVMGSSIVRPGVPAASNNHRLPSAQYRNTNPGVCATSSWSKQSMAMGCPLPSNKELAKDGQSQLADVTNRNNQVGCPSSTGATTATLTSNAVVTSTSITRHNLLRTKSFADGPNQAQPPQKGTLFRAKSFMGPATCTVGVGHGTPTSSPENTTPPAVTASNTFHFKGQGARVPSTDAFSRSSSVSSSVSSASSGSPIKCSPDEIERKRKEALERRHSRLKLSKSKK